MIKIVFFKPLGRYVEYVGKFSHYWKYVKVNLLDKTWEKEK